MSAAALLPSISANAPQRAGRSKLNAGLLLFRDSRIFFVSFESTVVMFLFNFELLRLHCCASVEIHSVSYSYYYYFLCQPVTCVSVDGLDGSLFTAARSFFDKEERLVDLRRRLIFIL